MHHHNNTKSNNTLLPCSQLFWQIETVYFFISEYLCVLRYRKMTSRHFKYIHRIMQKGEVSSNLLPQPLFMGEWEICLQYIRLHYNERFQHQKQDRKRVSSWVLFIILPQISHMKVLIKIFINVLVGVALQ